MLYVANRGVILTINKVALGTDDGLALVELVHFK